MEQDKPVGIIKSVGRSLAQAWARLQRRLAAMGKAHRKRSWWERSLAGMVAAGLVAGVSLALLDSVPFRSLRHGGELHEGAVQEEGATGAAGAGLAQPQGGGSPAGLADVDPRSAAGFPSPGTTSLNAGAPSPGAGTSVADSAVPSPAAGLPSVEAGAAGQGGGSGQEEAPLSRPDEEPATGPQAAGETGVRTSAPQQLDVPVASIESMEWPVSGGILRPFGWYRHPVFGDWRHSSAVVLQPPAGGSAVTAALAGRVTEVVNAGGMWRVTIRHAGGWETEYEGLASVDVSSYEVVATGQVIGYAPDVPVGGVAFAVYRDGVAVDPTELLGEPAATVQAP